MPPHSFLRNASLNWSSVVMYMCVLLVKTKYVNHCDDINSIHCVWGNFSIFFLLFSSPFFCILAGCEDENVKWLRVRHRHLTFLHVIMCDDDDDDICSSFFLTHISSSKQTIIHSTGQCTFDFSVPWIAICEFNKLKIQFRSP